MERATAKPQDDRAVYLLSLILSGLLLLLLAASAAYVFPAVDGGRVQALLNAAAMHFLEQRWFE